MYKQTNKQLWSGRIDSDDSSDFRFHQVISVQNLAASPKNETGFGMIGFASDEGVRRNKGRVGARSAPDAIRKHLAKLPYNINEMKTTDYGNIICEGDQLEKAQHELGEKVTELLHCHQTPIILGGGHETLYGHYLGVREFLKRDKTIGIINIDAHFDLRKEEVPSSGTMFRQILENDAAAGYMCLGIQSFGNTGSLFQAADYFGCHYVLEEEIQSNTMQHTFRKMDDFAKKYDCIMMTLCMDSIISSAAPGVSAPSPFGLDPKMVRSLLNYIAAKENTISFDISEVNPELDENDKTVRLAAYLTAETMNSFSLKGRKQLK